MRANEFLKEMGLLSLGGDAAAKRGTESVTITIPRELLNIQTGHDELAETQEDMEEVMDEADESAEEQQDEDVEVQSSSNDDDELANIVRLSGAKKAPSRGPNNTIAAPATGEVPEAPVFISPLQQQLELQKQQGGKESPVINQIIDDTILGSTAGEQPEQSVYHDSPLQDNEWVGAGTGSVDEPGNKATTKGATKPWYKL